MIDNDSNHTTEHTTAINAHMPRTGKKSYKTGLTGYVSRT